MRSNGRLRGPVVVSSRAESSNDESRRAFSASRRAKRTRSPVGGTTLSAGSLLVQAALERWQRRPPSGFPACQKRHRSAATTVPQDPWKIPGEWAPPVSIGSKPETRLPRPRGAFGVSVRDDEEHSRLFASSCNQRKPSPGSPDCSRSEGRRPFPNRCSCSSLCHPDSQ